MTTIITRLFADAAAAKMAVDALLGRDHDPSTINVITASGAGSVAERLRATRVAPEAAAIYARLVEAGNVLVVVAAPFNPIGTARDAIEVMNRQPSLKVGVEDEDRYWREQPRTDLTGSVDRNHTLWMTRPGSIRAGGHVAGGSVSSPRTRRSAIKGGAYISTKFWPMKLISTHRERRSAISGGRLMFGRNLMPTGWTISGLFGVPLILQR